MNFETRESKSKVIFALLFDFMFIFECIDNMLQFESFHSLFLILIKPFFSSFLRASMSVSLISTVVSQLMDR